MIIDAAKAYHHRRMDCFVRYAANIHPGTLMESGFRNRNNWDATRSGCDLIAGFRKYYSLRWPTSITAIICEIASI